MDIAGSTHHRIDAEEARRLLRHSGMELAEHIELDSAHYDAIDLEEGEHALVFVPAGKTRRLVVLLHQPVGLPRVVLFRRTEEGWIDLLESDASAT